MSKKSSTFALDFEKILIFHYFTKLLEAYAVEIQYRENLRVCETIYIRRCKTI